MGDPRSRQPNRSHVRGSKQGVLNSLIPRTRRSNRQLRYRDDLPRRMGRRAEANDNPDLKLLSDTMFESLGVERNTFDRNHHRSAFDVADTNSDGKIDSKEMTTLVMYLLKKIYGNKVEETEKEPEISSRLEKFEQWIHAKLGIFVAATENAAWSQSDINLIKGALTGALDSAHMLENAALELRVI